MIKFSQILKEQKLPPSETFTKDYLQKRTMGKYPKTLYHFATQRKAEFNINNKTIKSHMTSGVSLTENPAIAGPGSICFVIDANCVERLGYTIVPYLYGDSYLREAEWLVTKNPEYVGDHVFSGERVLIPSSCWKRIAITADTGATREFKEYAESKGFEVSFMDWEEEWNQ